MKMCLVMETIVKLTHIHSKIIVCIGKCKIQHCFIHPNGLTTLTKILNLLLWSDDSSNETKLNFKT